MGRIKKQHPHLKNNNKYLRNKTKDLNNMTKEENTLPVPYNWNLEGILLRDEFYLEKILTEQIITLSSRNFTHVRHSVQHAGL